VGAPHSPRSHSSEGSAAALFDASFLVQNQPSLSHKANACEINQLSTLTKRVREIAGPLLSEGAYFQRSMARWPLLHRPAGDRMKDPDHVSIFPSLADLDGRPKTFIRVSEIISALSYALDLTEGQPMGHSVRACIIGMRLAEQIGLPTGDRGDLYYALLLKDAGCSSNSSRLFHIVTADEIKAKRDVKLTDWTRVGWESLHYALTHVATGACHFYSA
jgi:HD-GYP domain-containing protein (c-di-GMP phosphodiesterase class II)